MRALVVAGAIALAVAGCRPTTNGHTPECTETAQCDDSIGCTVDMCEVGGTCSHRPVDQMCESSQRCDPEAGCVDAACDEDGDCDDGIGCTLDMCGVDGCRHEPLDDRCADGETCVEGTGCQVLACDEDGDCDDGIECTIDACDIEGECGHIADNSTCEEGSHCVEGVGCLAGDCDDNTDCDNGDFCDGEETCHPEFGCQPPETERDCNDNDECTIDTCDAEADLCSYELDPEVEGCDTFNPEDHLSGCFSIAPSVSQRCAWGHVNYSFSEVCFELVGPVLSVTAGTMSLDQTPAPSDATFAVETVISGGCTETYGLSGTFTGANSFSGTWTANFTDVDGYSCALSGCRVLNIPLTGTRTSGP